MGVASLLTRDATITRRSAAGTRNPYGKEDTTEATSSVKCEIQQQRTNDRTALGEVTEEFWSLFLPAGTSIDAGDAVTVDGETFEVYGPPWSVRNPRTKDFSHVECTVKRAG